jgi:predicted ATPase/DNA-binding XRE family transcriptional regulator
MNEKTHARRTEFGERLRSLREAAGLTQEELASRAGMTAKGVSALERGERKRPYPHTVRSLADALELTEPERASLFAAIPGRTTAVTPYTATGTAPPSDPAPAAAPASPPPTPFTSLVGRESELGEIMPLLRDSRLLTLTGTGGVGKTRLAAETARRAEGFFPGGVVYVGLASLGDAALVLPTVARSLGLKEVEDRRAREALSSLLSGKKTLLVLDNFEHVLEAAPDVAALIEEFPHLTVLATSRAPLRLRGEQEYPVQPLALPASTHNPSVGEVHGSAAGRLFVERAKGASPSFEVTARNAASVAAICWRLDGLPLALELAAARARFLDPASLLSRLDRALSAGWARDLPERQRTMRAALDWSHELLTGDERVLFRRLSVFAGGFTLDAAEEVGAGGDLDEGEVFEVLGTLVEQSLVVMESETAATRFRALEPVRQYALEKLEESEEEGEVRGRHAGHYLRMLKEAGPGLKGPDQGFWVNRLTVELDNVRAALEWATDNGQTEKIAEACWDSWTFWWSSGNLREGRRRMEDALAAEPELPDLARARLLFIVATFGQAVGDFESTLPMIEESRELFERLDHKRGIADAHGTGGLIALGLGRPEEGLRLMQRAVELDLEADNEWGAAAMLGFSAVVPFLQGDLERARGFAERGLDLARGVGARDILYVTLHPLAAIALAQGDYEGARRLFEESARLALEVGEKVNVAFCLEGLAAVAAEAILEDIEVIAYPFAPDSTTRERRISEAKAGLDDEAWARAWSEGRSMTPDQAVAYAIGVGGTSPVP